MQRPTAIEVKLIGVVCSLLDDLDMEEYGCDTTYYRNELKGIERQLKCLVKKDKPRKCGS